MEFLTDAVYRASKHPEVQALYALSITDREGREALASKLNAQGFIIDRMIDIYGADAAIIMGYRKQLGFTWVPSAFQPNLIDPFKTGVPMGSVPTDMTKPWDRSIKVSIDAADYRAFSPAPLPPTAPDHVGALNGDIYSAVNVELPNGAWAYAEGQQVTHNGIVLCFHLGGSIFGMQPMWLTAEKYDAWQKTGVI